MNTLFTLIILFSVLISSAYGDETKIATVDSLQSVRTSRDTRFSVKIQGQEIVHRNMNETYTFYPAADLLQRNNTDEWNRQWKEECASVTIVYNMVARNRLAIEPGIILGSNWGKFSAENVDTGFLESWETHAAFLWGGLIRTELRASTSDGPFIRSQYSICTAESGEKDETVYPSARPGLTENRYARFRWQNEELSFAVGWRENLFAAMAGVRHTSFELKKRISFNMPESSSDPVAAILNEQGSQYNYENRRPWTAYLALELQIYRDLTLMINSNITGDQDCRLSLKWSF